MSKKRFFDNIAEEWDDRYSTQDLHARLENIVSKFKLKKRARVLDVGSGTGILLPVLLECIGDEGTLTAVDFSEKMLSKAHAKFGATSKIRFCQSSVEDLPFDSSLFDYVICFAAFPHFEDKSRALSEMHRVLHRSGKVFIAHALGSRALKHHHQSSPEVAHDVLPEEAEIKKLLVKCGFDDISVSDSENSYICKGKKGSCIF
jgi:ubiquinone/menaquinone biosynthesis C-methylase UbiE